MSHEYSSEQPITVDSTLAKMRQFLGDATIGSPALCAFSDVLAMNKAIADEFAVVVYTPIQETIRRRVDEMPGYQPAYNAIHALSDQLRILYIKEQPVKRAFQKLFTGSRTTTSSLTRTNGEMGAMYQETLQRLYPSPQE